jgi:hypothetical protein
MILCHSNQRCQEITEFLQEITKFCKEIVDIVSFDQLDDHDIKQEWKNRTKINNKKQANNDGEDIDKQMIYIKNKILVVTPQIGLTLFNKNIVDSK